MVNWLIKLTFLSTILLVCCNNSEQIKQIERQIMEIDTKIACIRPTPIDTRIQFRRLFDITIPLGSLKPTLN